MSKKRGIKRKHKDVSKGTTKNSNVEKENALPPPVKHSDEPVEKKAKWINKTRVLVFSSRGVSHRDRHLMKDLRSIMPHSKDENKMERKENLTIVNEMCQMKNCNKCILLEGRLKRDLYMWVANTPSGPSAKFLVESVYTMGELKLTGNCLKGSRPLLSFDKNFNEPHYALLKELFTQVFGTPNHHPKSQPFVDRVITFSVHDNRIWYRNYQIVSEEGGLAEIGPRFVLNPIKIFEGSFCGATLWENPHYVTPSSYRRQLKLAAAGKYLNRKQQKEQYKLNKPDKIVPSKPEDEMFHGDPMEVAEKIVKEKELEETAQEINANNEWKPHKLFKPHSKKSSIPKVKASKLKKMKGKKKKNKVNKVSNRLKKSGKGNKK
ncbi:ribosome biogenesis protein BRX1 homolog [Lycorma delicatula]|uniref:ribosome biogenesis protein BRX1 homolog n=1 Tax=Lycorma delicatula TaxID=130591 RepID=UPI003F51164C